jgi:hypothetical protein
MELAREFERKEDTYITTFGAEEVADMPFSSTSDDNFSFDRCLAAFASWAEQFVKVKVAIEP